MKKYTVELTSYAKKMLSNIKDRRIKKDIIKQIDSLEEEPEKKGKPLVKTLAGFYCIRASGQRYRIIYKIEKIRVMVYVVTIGIRKEGSPKDIYSLTQKLVRLKLLDIPDIFEINDENINILKDEITDTGKLGDLILLKDKKYSEENLREILKKLNFTKKEINLILDKSKL